MQLDEAVAQFEALFAEVDDKATHTTASHAPNGAMFNRWAVENPRSDPKVPAYRQFETREEAVTAWLEAIKATAEGKTKLWWRARPRIEEIGGGLTVYCSYAMG